jgi:phenylpropionate dioxygenase-like ring-hydroxylating dioxygenase large terminal subunit
VLDELCMHRGVSLALGRNEEGGLRCLFHGWKYAVDGTVLETPNVCGVKAGLRAPAYPVYEQGGLVWAYVGAKDRVPPRRAFAHEAVPDANRVVIRTNVNASWLPLMEGGLDSSHVPILHTNQVRPAWRARAPGDTPGAGPGSVLGEVLVPEIKVARTPFGFHYCALRALPGEGAGFNGRLVPAVLPNIRLIPFGDAVVGAIEVPIDDEHTSTYTIVYSATTPIDRAKQLQTFGFVPPFYDERTCDLALDWRNGLGQDRSIMRDNWTGYRGIELEDYAVTVSMGSDWDRSKEHLVRSDAAIVLWRRVLLENLDRIANGEAPQAVDFEDLSRIRGYDRSLGAQESWQSAAPDYTRLFGPVPDPSEV